MVDPQRMMCTYGPAEGFLLNHSYMHGVCGSISTQYAVRSSIDTHRLSGLVLSLARHIMPFRGSAIVPKIILRSLSSGQQRRSLCASLHPPNGGYLPLLTVASWCLAAWAALFTRVRGTGILGSPYTSPWISASMSLLCGASRPAGGED